METKTIKTIVIICLGLIITSTTAWLFLRDIDTTNTHYAVHSPHLPKAIPLGDTIVVYTETQITRDHFAIREILGQTTGGYIALVQSNEDTFDLYRSIARVSECLMDADVFFETPPEWGVFLFAAVNEYGWLYVLDESGLLIYDAIGVFVRRVYWYTIPDIMQYGAGKMYVMGNYIVHMVSDAITILTTDGTFIRYYGMEYFEHEWLLPSSTAAGGYIFVLTAHQWFRGEDTFFHWFEDRNYTVRKIEVTTGNIIWSKYWEDVHGVERLLFCNNQQLLYLMHPQRIYVYSLMNEQVHFISDLTNARSRTMQRVLSASLFSESVLSDGRLHFAFSQNPTTPYERFAHFTNWVLTPLVGDEAQAYLNALMYRLSTQQVLSYLGFFEIFDIRFQNELRDFVARQNMLLDITYAATHGHANTHFDYLETINTALFARTAAWDIIHFPWMMDISTPFDKSAFVNRGLFYDLLPYSFGVFNDDTRFYAHLMNYLTYKGGLYHLPSSLSVPFVLVPKTHPQLDYLVKRALNWTWDDFLTIAHQLTLETGEPAISANNAFLRPNGVNPLPAFLPQPISNVPPFFLFNEDLLFSIGNGEKLDEFGTLISLYASLANTDLQHRGRSVFTFACTRALYFDVTTTHAILPMPTAQGEFIFYDVGIGTAVLTTGKAASQAAIFLIDDFLNRFETNPLMSAFRPCLTYVEEQIGTSTFEDYLVVVNRANTFLRLPNTVRFAIYDVVAQYVQSAITHTIAVERVATIMWIFTNER